MVAGLWGEGRQGARHSCCKCFPQPTWLCQQTQTTYFYSTGTLRAHMEVSTAVTQHQSEQAAHVPSQSIGCGSVTATQAAVRVVHSEVADAVLAQGANLAAAHAVIFSPFLVLVHGPMCHCKSAQRVHAGARPADGPHAPEPLLWSVQAG